jgi:hypothetical protein
LDAANIPKDHLATSDVPALLDAVRQHLDDEESATFSAWAIAKGYAASYNLCRPNHDAKQGALVTSAISNCSKPLTAIR